MIIMSKLKCKTLLKWQIFIKKILFWPIYKKIKNMHLEKKRTKIQKILTCISQMTNSIKLFKFKRKLFWKSKQKLKIQKCSNNNTTNFMMLCHNGCKHFLDFKIYSGSFMMKKWKNTMKIISKFCKIYQNNMNSMKKILWMKILE